jgi:SH3-like domain-containing protein
MDLDPDELVKAREASPGAKNFQKVLFNGQTLIFRNPTRQEYKQFRQIYDADGQESAAYAALAGTLSAIPSPSEWEALLEEYPGAGNNVSVITTLNILTGITSKETAK